MQSYWDPVRHHTVYPIDAPPDASPRERAQFRQNLKRADRVANGRCPYCGRYPEPEKTHCARCLELQQARNARAAARRRERREAERRAAQPRRCSGCDGNDLTKSGIMAGRQYYRCRDCHRRSTGDGPPPAKPDYPCPYCGARCIRRGTRKIGPRIIPRFQCTACKRYNSRLWPNPTNSPGGPFPYEKTFCLTYPAQQALMDYCQTHKMSIAQSVRDIFIRAGNAPLSRITLGHTTYDRDGRAIYTSKTTEIRNQVQHPDIPPGGVQLPSAMPEARVKLTKMRNGSNRFNPSILITLQVNVALNAAALAGLIETMRRRRLNHQDAARALILETAPRPNRNAPSRYYDPDADWH